MCHICRQVSSHWLSSRVESQVIAQSSSRVASRRKKWIECDSSHFRWLESTTLASRAAGRVCKTFRSRPVQRSRHVSHWGVRTLDWKDSLRRQKHAAVAHRRYHRRNPSAHLRSNYQFSTQSNRLCDFPAWMGDFVNKLPPPSLQISSLWGHYRGRTSGAARPGS